MKFLYLKIKEVLAPYFNVDPMRYRIERFRAYGVTIGENARLFSSVVTAEPYLVTLGDNVTVASGVRFITHDNSAIKVYEDATDFVGPIVVGNNVFIGSGALILPGVTIADNCIVGAGAVVVKSVKQEGAIIAGNPARVIGDVSEMSKKYDDKKFNFRGCDSLAKREKILSERDKWIIK